MKSRARTRLRLAGLATASLTALGLALVPALSASAQSASSGGLPVRPGAIQHIIVVELENESFGSTFGPSSPATYLNDTLVPQGELLKSYYGVGHVSLDNYIAQVSGQAPNLVTNSDCAGGYNDVTPGTLDANQALYLGQVDGQGCVFPKSVQTIGNQLDRAYPFTIGSDWRQYSEDMGNDPARDGGQADPLGGTDCAHPTQTTGVATDDTNNAEGPSATGSQVKSAITDQYANRHNPFVWFHSVTDNTWLCNHDVVPLGTAATQSDGAVSYQGHLAQDLKHEWTTPRFAFITPNLCNDGHDATCAGTNDSGTTAGSLVGADDFLRTWMPLILNSPAYRSGHTLVMITFDEGSLGDTAAGDNEQAGPNNDNPGYSPLLNTPIAAFGGKTFYELLGVTGITPNVEPAAGTMPGGGQVGAVLFNPDWIKAGSTADAVTYNHYSALRTFEDLLGIRFGGADGHGHLGFAATATAFGPDVFNAHPTFP
ncbi:MAG TPA: alkaline phosphatase family protein [Streptosporangiaceae bacterium]